MLKFFGLPKNVFFLGVTSFFNDLSSEMVLSVFPAFFASVLKTGAASLGLVEGIADGLANIIKIYSGRLSDRVHRRKPFIIIGYALSTVTRPLYLLVGGIAGVIGLRATDRMGKGLREGPRDAVIAQSVDPAQEGRSFGYHRAMDAFGGIVGPLLAYFIMRYFDHGVVGIQVVFVVSFVAGLCAIGSLFFVRDINTGESFARGSIRQAMQQFYQYAYTARRFLLALFFLSLGTMPVAVLLLRVPSIGLPMHNIPLLYMTYSIPFMLLSPLAGIWSDRTPPRFVIGCGYLVLLMSYALFVWTQSLVLLIVAFVLFGAFLALTDGVSRSYFARLVPTDHRAGLFGLFHAVAGIGAIGAGILGGLSWQFLGIPITLSIFGGVILLGIIFLFVGCRDGVC